MSIEDWWLVIGIPDVLYVDIHLALVFGVIVLGAVIKVFKRSRNTVELDNRLALLGTVYPKKPKRNEHGPAFYKNRRKGL